MKTIAGTYWTKSQLGCSERGELYNLIPEDGKCEPRDESSFLSLLESADVSVESNLS